MSCWICWPSTRCSLIIEIGDIGNVTSPCDGLLKLGLTDIYRCLLTICLGVALLRSLSGSKNVALFSGRVFLCLKKVDVPVITCKILLVASLGRLLY